MSRLIADVSDWQRPVDPSAYKSRGVSGVITKITESNNFVCKTAKYNLQVTRGAGMLAGAYHFLHYRDAGQADWYLDHVEAAWGGHDGLIHMLDVETEGGGKKPDAHDVEAFITRFYQRTNNHPLLLYSGTWYWKGTIGNPQQNWGTQLIDASYVNGGGDPREIVKGVTMGYWRPYGTWKGPLLRQFTASAKIPGEPGMVDMSVLYGTEAELAGLVRGSSKPPDPWATRATVKKGTGMPPAAPHGDVKFLQQSLNDLHTRNPLVADGRFGDGTDKAVRDFQAFLKVKDPTVVVDGVVGPVTWRAVYFFLALAKG